MAWTLQCEDNFAGSFNDPVPGRTPAPSGSVWGSREGGTADWVIGVSNEAIVLSGSGNTWLRNTTTLANKQAAEITARGSGVFSSDYGGFGVRLNAAGDGYVVRTRGDIFNDIELFRVDDGTPSSPLGSSGTGWVAGDVLRIEADGDQITVLLNGSIVIGPVTDAAYSSGDAGLFYINGSVATSFRSYDEAGGGDPALDEEGLTYQQVTQW